MLLIDERDGTWGAGTDALAVEQEERVLAPGAYGMVHAQGAVRDAGEATHGIRVNICTDFADASRS